VVIGARREQQRAVAVAVLDGPSDQLGGCPGAEAVVGGVAVEQSVGVFGQAAGGTIVR
jgi:hypothetical protein